jgi:hypothetical protein
LGVVVARWGFDEKYSNLKNAKIANFYKYSIDPWRQRKKEETNQSSNVS